MSPNAPEAEKLAKEPAPAADAPVVAATDEDILRLRSRLEREFAVVGQKIADAEEAIIDIEVSLRTYESGTRPRLPSASKSTDPSGERITARMKIGDGFSKLKDWVSKPKEGEAEGNPGTRQGSGIRLPARPGGDLEDRLEEALRCVAAEIKERERQASDLDRKLHDAQRELIRQRAQEQHARETQIKLSQAKQLSEDYERKMAAINEMVRSFESGGKSEAGAKPKPKESASSAPNFDDRLQSAVDDALKGVAAQEKKVADLEKGVERANASLVEERALQQRIRAMQIRLRQARYFSTDLQRALDALGSSLDELRHRAGGLLKPKPGKAPEPAPKPSGV